MKKSIILISLIIIIIISFLIIQMLPEQKKDKIPLNQSVESFSSKPMNTSTSILNREFQVNVPQSSGMIAWESVCLIDDDCTFVENFGEIGMCINLKHTKDTSGLIINEDILCVCKPLVLELLPTTEENVSVWIEDQGSIICQIEEDKPDLSILNFEVTPENPKIEERVIYNTTIKNIGTSGCSMVDTIVNFGDGSSGWIKMSWCTHYGYTPEQCRQMGFEPYFNPGEIINPSIDWYYNAMGVYNVTVVITCQQTEWRYNNNNADKIIYVLE